MTVDLDAARAEVERLKSELAEARDTVGRFVQFLITSQGNVARLVYRRNRINQWARKTVKERDRLRRQRDRLVDELRGVRSVIGAFCGHHPHCDERNLIAAYDDIGALLAEVERERGT
jgi:hypothetical protein